MKAEVVTPVYAAASPSGRVSTLAFEQLAGVIVGAARDGTDAILLDLHGAMVS